jgi:hypothetical protein
MSENYSNQPKFLKNNKLPDNKNIMTTKKLEGPETLVHKNFGKTPEYLKKYKQEAENKKENEY